MLTMETTTRTRVLIRSDRRRVGLAELSDLANWLRPHMPSVAYGGSWQWSYQDWGVIFTLDAGERAALTEVREAVADCPFPINGVEVLSASS